MPESPELTWTKSSFSEASGNACVEVATLADDGLIALRESDSPHTVLVADRDALRALLSSMKAGRVQRP
ncbi:DUF397 domain-containing protein [Streptomyces sp. BE230]|uniref:DUF397 domain-containing protein n=1 Tax=Streptomyces sp. BE230 TaxID=3002526 RepID=UPI002ED2B592|nr:DUF397 domain-containing protein [Streptomyces sp. BE230]